ncbi:hypothetical protein ACFL1R_09815 [Candidatus Latescibacterota bacterium]
MKKLSVLMLLCISLFRIQSVYAQGDILEQYPHVVLSNGIIEASVFLPDKATGFYRSSRFEWSGMIRQLTYEGHTYFTTREHREPHDPENPGHAISLAEEFSIGTSKEIPQRFYEAQPGETFMKIGVGNLEKPVDAKRYSFGAPYKNADPGTWTVSHGKYWVEFTHELSDAYGYGYIYVKRMELSHGKPELVISHSLKNTGTKVIIADQYNHNFFTIDNMPMAKNYEVDLFFSAQSERDLKPNVSLVNNTLVFDGEEGSVFTIFKGFSDSVSHNHCIIRCTKTGAGVDIKGDFPLSGFNFWSDGVTVCPELFLWIVLDPGETQSWKRIYAFFEE